MFFTSDIQLFVAVTFSRIPHTPGSAFFVPPKILYAHPVPTDQGNVENVLRNAKHHDHQLNHLK